MSINYSDLYKLFIPESYKSTILSAMDCGYQIAFSMQDDDSESWNENTKVKWYSNPFDLINALKHKETPVFLYFKDDNESFEQWKKNGWVLIYPFDYECYSIHDHDLKDDLKYIISK